MIIIRFLKLLSVLFVIISFQSENLVSGQNCDTILYGNPSIYTLIDGNNLSGIGPGSTICLKGGNYYQIRVINLYGSAEQAITIKPIDSVVHINNNTSYAIKVGNSRYLHLDGALSGFDYGVNISGTGGNGISVDDLASDIEINHFEISNTNIAGIMAKTDPDCSFTSTRDSFTMYNVHFHHNYIHHTRTEGFYIGSSFFNGKSLQCNGQDTIVYPHIIKGVSVHHNRLEYTGYDGIQVSSSTENCSIHDNIVRFDSDKGQYGQMSGIIVGDGASCDCYNNDIRFGKGIGIEVHGTGGQRIFNNIIVECGRTYRPLTQGAYSKPGIYVSYNLYNPGNLPYQIFNNTIYKPKSEGIRFSNVNATDNLFYNNIIIDPGIWDYYDSSNIPTIQSYINVNVNVNHVEKTNYFSRNSQVFGFVDTLNYNLKLQKWSLGVDNGSDVSAWNIVFDVANQTRPIGKSYDIGAYEYQTGESSNLQKKQISLIKSVWYKKSNKQLKVEFANIIHGKYQLSISDIQGKRYYSETKTINRGESVHIINFKTSLPDIIILSVDNNKVHDSVKIITQ
ncbi:MAG: choice-of-anchor Q domain-containing protein [Bacteroidales bacterium]|nr:choice-of-anchor Q domain-containing protein [Bacteroidales bacterium]